MENQLKFPVGDGFVCGNEEDNHFNIGYDCADFLGDKFQFTVLVFG